MKFKIVRGITVAAAASALATAFAPAALSAKRPVAPPNSGGTVCANLYIACTPTPVPVAL